MKQIATYDIYANFLYKIECREKNYILFTGFIIFALFLLGTAVVFNISLRNLVKKRTQELSEEKKFLDHVLKATSTNINITDASYNLRYVDLNWQKVYGDPAGRKCYEYFMKRSSPCEICGMPEAMEKKETVIYEETMPSENGRIVEVHTIPFQNSKGEWLFAEFNVDITRRRKAEEALQTAQKLESLGILAGGIAHDFNNLLAGIFGNVNLASELSDNSEAKEYLTTASTAIERARSLTGQLLTFAKGGEPVKKPGKLTPFIENTVLFALSGSKISCRFDIPDDLWACEFDKNQIGQVIDNLVINAKQAMSDGGEIEVCAHNTYLPEQSGTQGVQGKFIKITVTDHGTGIPKEIMPKIFDPFFTTKSKGAGLGLATSYSIVKRHGGFIKVESEPGAGSSFSVFLPATSKNPSTECENPEKKHQGSGIFILMDDQEIIRLTTGKMLESLGYSVVSKTDGASVLKYLENSSENIAGMIFDLTIPGGMGGLETVSKIRENDRSVPVFVSSGYANDPVMADPRKYGFTASIAKPFTRDELLKMLNSYIPDKKD